MDMNGTCNFPEFLPKPNLIPDINNIEQLNFNFLQGIAIGAPYCCCCCCLPQSVHLFSPGFLGLKSLTP